MRKGAAPKRDPFRAISRQNKSVLSIALPVLPEVPYRWNRKIGG